MSDKKHIDRIFQESFKDFEATPNDVVWKNIEAKLNQKNKKRRVIPIWWRYTGVAALLVLLLTIGINYFYNNDSIPKTNTVVDTKNNAIDTSKQQDEKANSFKELNSMNEVIITDNNTSKDNLNINDDKAVANIDSKEDILQKKPNSSILVNKPVNNSKESSIAGNSTSINKNQSKTSTSITSNKKSNNTNSTLKTEDKTAIALNHKKEINNSKAILNSRNPSLINKNEADKVLNNISENNTIVAQNNTSKEDEIIKSQPENKLEDNTFTIEDAIGETKDVVIEKEKLSRWSLAPNIAPVYFNTLGEGSSIDKQFNNNSKTGDLNMSYGISASYAVNKKVTIRSGVNRVNLGYNTNNVVVFQSLGVTSSSALSNVDVNSNSGSVADALSTAGTETVSVISAENFNSTRGLDSFSTNSSINQSLGYIEVPLEIQYSILDKKFGFNVIGGFSSFFLSDNKIYSDLEGGGRTFLGEANNINEVSYSANFGLGLNYKVSKKIDFNLEPMFKYQINTFNNTSGDFQPFFLGIYSGFAIKF